jgi:hypothetical protein
VTERTAATTSPAAGTREPPADAGATAEFERLYRANVDERVDIAGLRPKEAAADWLLSWPAPKLASWRARKVGG